MARNVELTVVLPGLANILNQQMNVGILPTYLTKIIHHASFIAEDINLERLLVTSFSTLDSQQHDIPIASLMSENAHQLILSPCCLHPDRDQLLLFADGLNISDQESSTLMREVQPLVDDLGGQLIFHDAQHWLLELTQAPQIDFHALADVEGKSVDGHLPSGPDRTQWLTLWNEIQMQLFNSEVNQLREVEGKLTINGVWFWGTGTFKATENAWSSVQGSLPLLQLLAKQLDIDVRADKPCSLDDLTKGRHLCVLDKIDIEGDWLQQLSALDEQFLQPLWQASKYLSISKLNFIIPHHGSYTLTMLDCWKFWKR